MRLTGVCRFLAPFERIGAVLFVALTLIFADSAFNVARAVTVGGFSANLGVTGPGQNDVFFVPFSNPIAEVTITGLAQVSYSASSGPVPAFTTIKNINYLLFEGEETHDDYQDIIPANFTGLVIGPALSYSVTKNLPVGDYEATINMRISLENSLIVFADSSTIRNFSVVARDPVPEPGSGFILAAGLVLGGMLLRKRTPRLLRWF